VGVSLRGAGFLAYRGVRPDSQRGRRPPYAINTGHTDAEHIDPRPVLAEVMKRIEEYVEQKLELLGSIGKAT